MDNNIIEKIEGLDTLRHLIWLGKTTNERKWEKTCWRKSLDLSFNNITKIEGLDALTELTDLSLYHNRIKVIENMDNLKKLNVFSIGNNQVDDESGVSKLFNVHRYSDENFCWNRFDIYVVLIVYELFVFGEIRWRIKPIIMFTQSLIYLKSIFSIIN